MAMTKEHLEGRASALGEVIATLDERLAKGCGMWAYELRQELARVKGNFEKQAESAPSDYVKGFTAGENIAFDRGYESGYEARRGRPLYS